jgi:hypothetical protein
MPRWRPSPLADAYLPVCDEILRSLRMLPHGSGTGGGETAGAEAKA